MKTNLTPSWELSTEHSASSYGQPVLVNMVTGEAFGPDDIVKPYPSWEYMTASKAVKRMAKANNKKSDFIEKFIKGGKENVVNTSYKNLGRGY